MHISAAICMPAGVCGDGTVGAGEECDDGNTASGDGCSSTCTNEGLNSAGSHSHTVHGVCPSNITLAQGHVVMEHAAPGKSVMMATVPTVMAVHPHAYMKV